VLVSFLGAPERPELAARAFGRATVIVLGPATLPFVPDRYTWFTG
jgi:hypothetical protein